MKKPVFLFLYMIWLSSAAAQQATIDSLKAELSGAGRDTNRELKVETKEEEFAKFIIKLPFN